MGLQSWGQKFAGPSFPDALVIVIIIGAMMRSCAGRVFASGYFDAGISLSARFLLELAVMGLGASISVTILAESGLTIICTVVVLVAVTIGISYGLSRLLRLPPRLAFLIACGNAICGNSAIVAVACVIKAKNDEITAAIAFTAILGVAAVLLLPLSMPLFAFSDRQYGTFAGLSVYAVPQVLAATMPVSVIASHSGTIVKLIRVLMLGPLIFVVSLLSKEKENTRGRVRIGQLVPWFIIGFALLMGLRSIGAIPDAWLSPLGQITKFLTILSMAALGLGVDIRALTRSGGRVAAATTGSLLALMAGAALLCLFFIA